ncbi:MAG: hypothetical protein AAGD01_00095 [Acidobacteriota bacterium]
MDLDLAIALGTYGVFSLVAMGFAFWAAYAARGWKAGLGAAAAALGVMMSILLVLYLFVYPHLQELKQLN